MSQAQTPAEESEDARRAFHIDILTIFPEFFESPLNTGVIGKAIDRELFSARCIDIRGFATDKHRTTDDLPYGGGAGMVMKPEPLVAALEHARQDNPTLPRIYLTPQGRPFDQAMAREFAESDGFILVCGRYEGIDARVRDNWIDEEVSIGDFVLTGGEPAALIMLDAITRLIPGVLGNPASIVEESFSKPMLDYPHYTRPREFRGLEVPEVLFSGHHAKIEAWRRQQALDMTRARRPELLGEDS